MSNAWDHAAGMADKHASLVDGDGGGEDPPIDTETTAEFVSRLKALPRSDVNTFLEQFKVQRVRDLRKSDVEDARQLLGGLEARARRKAAPAKTTPTKKVPTLSAKPNGNATQTINATGKRGEA